MSGSGRPERIAIVGAGIVGAALAQRLVERGVDVTLLERGEVAAGATGRSFGWINASLDKQPRAYHELCRLGVLAWTQLDAELGGVLPIRRGGSLLWAPDDAALAQLEPGARQMQSWGYPVCWIDREAFARLEPEVEPGALRVALHATEEASIDPGAAAALLVGAAERAGAHIHSRCEVNAIVLRHGRVAGLETTRGPIPADAVVLATGVDATRLAAPLGVKLPLVASPGVLAHTSPIAARIGRVILGAEIHLKQKLDGRVVIGEHGAGFESADGSRAHGERLLAAAARLVPALAKARLEDVTVGYRPLPADGYPVIGFAGDVPGLYLTVMHSGVTLAALVAQLASLEILGGTRVERLEAYRPARFA